MTRVLDAIEQKAKKSQQLYENLVAAVNSEYKDEVRQFKNNGKLPRFMK